MTELEKSMELLKHCISGDCLYCPRGKECYHIVPIELPELPNEEVKQDE